VVGSDRGEGGEKAQITGMLGEWGGGEKKGAAKKKKGKTKGCVFPAPARESAEKKKKGHGFAEITEVFAKGTLSHLCPFVAAREKKKKKKRGAWT